MRSAEQPQVTVYSIGHSNHSFDHFLALLHQHGITALVDVRSAPYSRYVTHFNRPDLEDTIERHGIRYVYLGDELGGRPAGDEYYDSEGYVLYEKAAQSPLFQRGLDKLIDEGALYRAAMMCSEEDPTDCHRRLLIGRVLAEQDIAVIHIRADHREQTEADLSHEQQLSLWESAATVWKSVRPVAQRRRGVKPQIESTDWEADTF